MIELTRPELEYIFELVAHPCGCHNTPGVPYRTLDKLRVMIKEREAIIKDCEHEPDGGLYTEGKSKSLHHPDKVVIKCKKCGEFYR